MGHTPTMLTHEINLKYKGRLLTSTATHRSGSPPTFQTTVLQKWEPLFSFLTDRVRNKKANEKPIKAVLQGPLSLHISYTVSVAEDLYYMYFLLSSQML